MTDLEQLRREAAEALAAVRTVLADPWYGLPAADAEVLHGLEGQLQGGLATAAPATEIRAAVSNLDHALNALAEKNIDLLTGYLKDLT
jgi:hypothetical protein